MGLQDSVDNLFILVALVVKTTNNQQLHLTILTMLGLINRISLNCILVRSLQRVLRLKPNGLNQVEVAILKRIRNLKLPTVKTSQVPANTDICVGFREEL